ncbi:hypothetical protein P175DRAFT_0461997 [Aspergillus ochraceoroseus IBT 24754]|uniref:Alpha-tubulin suppressor protein Aats1 n=1 Tax=Aspergillus ochraceoroseus IBT 24754 TaxID=1392256 RepID=A0A2T5LSR6_9EURO|nr:uncharacterized protein P175DRAFT_0461997 [Aspergillus ochraceoroseus IBT 24754]PTU19327.1 hypothetical protein P175DRAFT_0461997 [Aspergillus ochraceoroseus IBT 24754]
MVVLFAFGSNGSGQLGIGHEDDVCIPTRCIFDEESDGKSPGRLSAGESSPLDHGSGRRITRIVAGGNHTLLLLENGAVYAAGCNEDGRCGWDPEDENGGCLFSVFKRVVIKVCDGGVERVFTSFKGVSATWEGTFLVTRSSLLDGERENVFVFGSGGKGELGLGKDCVRASLASGGMKIRDFPPRGTRIVCIASGMGHTVVVLSNGEVYGWGAARKGQLGASAVAQKIVWSPMRIEGIPFHVTGATCGREFTVLSGDRDAGEFAVLGGSAGNKWNILSDVPSSETVKGYVRMDASWHGVYVHQGDLSVHAWGRNDRGQLPPADLPKARKVAVGSEHVLALLEDPTVVAFGWGEHGNCGPDTDAQGNVNGVYSRISLPNDVEAVDVGAGCATSWIMAS